MSNFLRWLAAAVFVSVVIGGVVGGFAGWNARRTAAQNNPNRPSVYFQNIEEEVIGRVFTWTAGGMFVVLIFTSRVKLPAATKDIAWGAVAGVAIAVVGGHLLSTLFEKPWVWTKGISTIRHFSLWYGLPILGTVGGIVGYVRHRNQKRGDSKIADTEAISSP